MWARNFGGFRRGIQKREYKCCILIYDFYFLRKNRVQSNKLFFENSNRKVILFFIHKTRHDLSYFFSLLKL